MRKAFQIRCTIFNSVKSQVTNIGSKLITQPEIITKTMRKRRKPREWLTRIPDGIRTLIETGFKMRHLNLNRTIHIRISVNFKIEIIKTIVITEENTRIEILVITSLTNLEKVKIVQITLVTISMGKYHIS